MKAALCLLLSLAAAAAPGARAYTAPWNISEVKINPADQSRFPASRPPLWDFRTTAVKTEIKQIGLGWNIKVVHEDLVGVMPEMMTWLFTNLASATAAHPVTNTSYPIFLLMHPRDHVAHWLTPGAFKVGVNATWMEFPSTGCTDDGTGVGTCPSGAGTANPGWTSSSAVADWQFEEQLNSNTNIRGVSKSSVKFSFRGCSEQGCAWTTKTTQAWKLNKAKTGVTLTTTLRIGIGMSGPDTRITNGWRNGYPALAKANRAVRHYIEEYGTLPFWLPGAYNAAIAGK